MKNAHELNTDEEHKDNIESMTHLEMAELWRHAPVGHIYFNKTLPHFKTFSMRFREFGGMTTEISEQVSK